MLSKEVCDQCLIRRWGWGFNALGVSRNIIGSWPCPAKIEELKESGTTWNAYSKAEDIGEKEDPTRLCPKKFEHGVAAAIVNIDKRVDDA